MSARAPLVLFGAFDRHNFGDLLFPHVAAALLPGEEIVLAGLAERDLRPLGGHRVAPIARLAAEWGARPVNILHAGGEILDCDAWEAAVMLQPPELAARTVARLDPFPRARTAWARAQLGLPELAPYCLARERFPTAASVLYLAVGGTGLGRREPLLRAEVLDKLRAADFVSVRERHTQAQLAAAGVAARLVPDPAVMVAECLGATIARHAAQGEPAAICRAFPEGYLAVQFSADFGDDATLDTLAAGLEEVMRETGLGVVPFRAGAAPWHDELVCYERLAARLPSSRARIFRSLALWDICALVAQSRGLVGSSLHGRILAMAYGLPRLNVSHPTLTHAPGKQAAFAAAWDSAYLPATVPPEGLAWGVRQALTVDRAQRFDTARGLVRAFREGFDALRAALR